MSRTPNTPPEQGVLRQRFSSVATSGTICTPPLHEEGEDDSLSPSDVREEVLNVVLAEHLQDRGLLSLPETIIKAIAKKAKRLPDVTIADLFGVRIVIEGRLDKDDPTRESLLQLARQRVEEGISPICLAVLYPSDLRSTTSLSALKNALGNAPLIARVVSEGSDGEWARTDVDGIAAILRNSYELLVSEDVVVAAVEDLSSALEAASEIIVSAPAAPSRLRERLGIPEEQDDGEDEA